MENKEHTEKRGRGGLLAGFVLCFLLVLFLFTTSSLFPKDGDKRQAETSAAECSTEATAPKELSVTDLMKAVLTLKDDLETAVEDMGSGDMASAQQKADGVSRKTAAIRMSLDQTMAALGDGMPSLTNQLTNIQGLLELVDAATETLLKPMIQQVAAYPVSSARVEEGVDTRLICEYLDFLEARMPDVEAIVARAGQVDLSLVDSDGDLAQKLAQAGELAEIYRQDTSIFDSIKSFFGVDGDRLYVIAAQNSSEIRASGGFPGAIGTLRIRDGVLSLGDFKKVYDVLSPYTPPEAKTTPEEYRLFHGGLSAPRDSDFCPDFERVAYIWALGYEAKMHESVDGVISVTPVIVQRLLKALDEEIVLFDGTVLNGDNAVKGLQYDLYYKYFGNRHVPNGEVVSDQLFADAAKKTGQKLMENMKLEDLMEYVSIAGESFEDRTMMVWSKDETLQNAIEKLGWSGGLNQDPEKPQVGIYVNCTAASKMGWFLVMNTEIGARRQNEDGSYTYDVTVTFSNAMTSEELRAAGGYITGGGSAFRGSAYFFAPAGGSVENFSTSAESRIQPAQYHDLQLGFLQSFRVPMGESLEVTFQVTTAPGAEELLTISQTPTLQAYH